MSDVDEDALWGEQAEPCFCIVGVDDLHYTYWFFLSTFSGNKSEKFIKQANECHQLFCKVSVHSNNTKQNKPSPYFGPKKLS
jgi:hypothetical protein